MRMIVLNAASGEEIFSVKSVLKPTYSEEKYSGYTNILDDSGYCYLARQGTDTEITVTVDELKNSIKSLR